MIAQGVDAFGHRALVTAAPYEAPYEEGGDIREVPLEIGAEVAVAAVRDVAGNLGVIERGSYRMDRVHADCLTIIPTMPTPVAPITPEVAAHVLWHFRGLGYPPGSFTSALIKAIAAAAPSNRRLLARGFPDYVRAVNLATEEMNGIDLLRHVLTTRKPL